MDGVSLREGGRREGQGLNREASGSRWVQRTGRTDRGRSCVALESSTNDLIP